MKKSNHFRKFSYIDFHRFKNAKVLTNGELPLVSIKSYKDCYVLIYGTSDDMTTVAIHDLEDEVYKEFDSLHIAMLVGDAIRKDLCEDVSVGEIRMKYKLEWRFKYDFDEEE